MEPWEGYTFIRRRILQQYREYHGDHCFVGFYTRTEVRPDAMGASDNFSKFPITRRESQLNRFPDGDHLVEA